MDASQIPTQDDCFQNCEWIRLPMAKYPKQKDKAAPRCIRGVYVGKNALGDEHLLLTEAGVQTCRTARRLTESNNTAWRFLIRREECRGTGTWG